MKPIRTALFAPGSRDKVMAEDKRLDEIGNPPLRVESYGK